MAGQVVHEVALGSMFVGRKIRGTAQCSGSFDINLECKTPCGISSIPLQVSVRLEEGCITRNTFDQCNWGQEERDGGMPIAKGQVFTSELECKPQSFTISVNGRYFCDYKHRLPFDTINNLTVIGDVQICEDTSSENSKQMCDFKISINGCHFCDYKQRVPYDTINNLTVTGDVQICDVTLSGNPPQCGVSSENPQQSSELKPMLDNTVYETTLSSMFPGLKIKIEGSTTQCSSGFNINLECKTQCGTSSIPLRICVRFEEGCIVRNTFYQCAWGQEERDGAMPIIRGQTFIIQLECVCDDQEIDVPPTLPVPPPPLPVPSPPHNNLSPFLPPPTSLPVPILPFPPLFPCLRLPPPLPLPCLLKPRPCLLLPPPNQCNII